MACRDMKKCLEAREDIINHSYNKNVECMLCDLASLESIKNFADNINQSMLIEPIKLPTDSIYYVSF